MDLAWATLEYSMESGGLGPGDYVWIRRLHSEIPISDILPGYLGYTDAPIRVIGWPRAADATADGATWTNGSRTVDLITTLSIDREKHLGRFVTAPDGITYQIVVVTDSNTVLIDREYIGATVTGSNGAFTVSADEDWYDDMGTQYDFDDSVWTIKESDWDADADDLALIDYNGENIRFYINQDTNYYVANLMIIGGLNLNAMVYPRQSQTFVFKGCILDQPENRTVFASNQTYTVIDRCVFSTSGVGGSAQHMIVMNGAQFYIRNTSLIGSAGCYSGLYSASTSVVLLENVNIGVDGNIKYFFYDAYTSGSDIRGRDVKFGTPGTLFFLYRRAAAGFVSIENYDKVFGAAKTFTPQGTLTKTDVTAGSGDPYKRGGGADSVIEILFDLSLAAHEMPTPYKDITISIFTHEFEAGTLNKSYRYYVQTDTETVSASQLWIEVEYVDVYNGITTYNYSKVESDESISVRTGADDWSQYIEVTGIKPAIASKVRIKCYCSYYHATAKIWIDPKVEIT
jgi:hypothetical protein